MGSYVVSLVIKPIIKPTEDGTKVLLRRTPNVHENKMLSKLDMFVLLVNKGSSMDKRDEYWRLIKHADGGEHVRMSMKTQVEILG